MHQRKIDITRQNRYIKILEIYIKISKTCKFAFNLLEFIYSYNYKPDFNNKTK